VYAARAMACFDPETILAFVDGALPVGALADAQQHVAGCQSCADLVAIAASGGAIAFDPSSASLQEAGGDVGQAGLVKGSSFGRFVVLDLVGRGGMGEVYAAYDPQLDRKVAVKLLRQWSSQRLSVTAARARLLREAKAIARLSHPNVVVVHDAGELEGQAFVAMEFIDGQTLADWQAAAPRGWREIREHYLAAGQGLAAAHDAGLVHRDFKPHNVMVGRDGSIRVMDFGLAGDADDRGSAPGGGDGAPLAIRSKERLSTRTAALTHTGALLGTPLYMAPEQFLARATGPGTDQFSFCVALYQALYGQWPFANESLASLIDSVVNGRVRDPPDKARVPSFLRRLVMRGLSRAPEQRFPSMAALLRALRHDPGRQRRRNGVVAGLLLVASLAGFATYRAAPRGQHLCQGGGARLASAWEVGESGVRRQAVKRAFLATGRPFAGDTWQRVSALLDDWGRRWIQTYGDVCEATQVRGDQSAEVLDLRMACLDDARGALRALADVYARADAAVLVEAVNAARALPPLERCADVAALRAAVPPPRDAQIRRRVDDVRARLADVKALADTAQYPEALKRLTALVPDARATGYAPVVAEPLEVLGRIHGLSGDAEGARSELEEGVWLAIAARRDDLAVACAGLLVAVSGYEQAHFDEAERWYRLGDALLARAGPGQNLAKAWLLHDHGLALNRRGEYRRGLADLRAALALKQAVLPPDHHDIGISWEAIANVLGDLGENSQAERAIEAALTIYERSYGHENPLLARGLGNRGEIRAKLGRLREAEGDLRESAERWSSYVGPDHRWVAYPLTALGGTLTAQHRPREAVAVLERALRIREATELAPDLVAGTRLDLARALWLAGDDPIRARALAAQARAAYGQSDGLSEGFAARAREANVLLATIDAAARVPR
jgi:tetratricopeptide (TPR) repeat protein/tRNA A-37 threonylcarbamoyl transferase component Bud32